MKSYVPVLAFLAVAALVGWAIAGFLFGSNSIAWRVGIATGSVLMVIAIILGARGMPAGLRIATGLALLGTMLVITAFLLTGFPDRRAAPFGMPIGFTIVGVSAASLITVALLFHAGCVASSQEASAWDERRTSLASFLVGGLLLATTLHVVYWLMIWDSTYDPIGVIWLAILLAVAAITGLLIVILLPGRLRVVGLLVALAMPSGLIAVTSVARSVGFRERTEQHAELVARALDAYHERNGRYPNTLGDLVPRDALILPEPVILFGQSWCYDGGRDYYRLGFVDRRHWSDPRLIGRLYRSVGSAPQLPPVCAAEIDGLVHTYPDYFTKME